MSWSFLRVATWVFPFSLFLFSHLSGDEMENDFFFFSFFYLLLLLLSFSLSTYLISHP